MKKYVREQTGKTKKGGGERNMMSRILAVMMLVCVTAGIGNALTTDAFTITITPVLNYSVMISTTVTAAQLIDLNMGAMSQMFISTGINYTSQEITTATVYNNGNTAADWQINGSVVNTLGGKPWAFGTTAKDTVDIDSITVAIVLGDPSNRRISNVTDATFGNSDLIGTAWSNLQQPNFCAEAAGWDGDNVPYSGTTSRIVFYRLKTPSDISTSDPQAITINIRARPTGTF